MPFTLAGNNGINHEANHRARLLGQAQFFGGCAVSCVQLALSGDRKTTVAYKAVYGHARMAAHTAFLALPELRDDSCAS